MRNIIDYLLNHDELIIMNPSYNESMKESFIICKNNISYCEHCITRLDNVKCDSVIWWEGRSSINLTTFIDPYVEDSISFQFGGCLMARFKHMYIYFIAHIHMEKGSTALLDSFCEYIKEDYDNLIIFRPLIILDFECTKKIKQKINLEVMGIIDIYGQCYSVLIYKKDLSSFFVLAVAKHNNNHKVPGNLQGLSTAIILTYTQCNEFCTFTYIKDNISKCNSNPSCRLQ